MTNQELIDIVISPQSTTGDWFDTTLLAQAKKYGDLFPANPPPLDQFDAYVLMNYYDLARSEYVAYRVSGDELYRDRGRKVADSWFQCPYFKSGAERHPDNNTSPKFAGIAGLILRAIDGRPEMWDTIDYWTRYYLDLWILRRADGTYKDIHIREGAFALHFAVWLARLLPDSFSLTAGGIATDGATRRARYLADIERAINYFARIQYLDGSWRWDDWYSTGDDGSLLKGIMQPFMIGMLTRALCDAHELPITEASRSLAAKMITSACRHLYADGPFTRGIATHFNVAVNGFHYFYHGGTELNPTRYASGDFPFSTTVDWHVPSARQLMAMCIGSFGFAYKISGDPFFKTAGDEMYAAAYSGRDGVRAMMNDTAKNFNQHVYGTSNYKAWTGALTVPTPTPLPEPIPTQPAPAPTEPTTTTPSPDGTKGTTIIDSQGAVWAIGPNKETLRDQRQMGGGQGTEYKYLNKTVYVLGDIDAVEANKNWYQWRDSAWFSVGTAEPGLMQPEPTPEPQPIPQPVPVPCKMTISDLTLPSWGSGVITVTLENMAQATEVKAVPVSGQVTVSPGLKKVSGTSAVIPFQVSIKKKGGQITFSSGCGSQTVTVNVK